MGRKGYKTINIPPALIQEIENSVHFDQETDMFHKWVVNTVENILYKRKYLSNFAQEMKLESISKNGLIIEDQKLKNSKLIKVTIKKDTITCSQCLKTICKHILFAIGSPEFGEVVKNQVTDGTL